MEERFSKHWLDDVMPPDVALIDRTADFRRIFDNYVPIMKSRVWSTTASNLVHLLPKYAFGAIV